ncbi:NAD-dependent epimerase/dehydratase family protein [Thermoanaerobacterium sp. R66]|uniref:NAD-dependent epimerase/dehydratase family protein n=1 Tax=Thermoanaerobacterium sp. R66 TaxID=2742479 RepID=UPI002380912D|nr:NAD-dependent epimerase/dehydratase family protein [Thermoanaerobacterium sp. R66]MDE4541323.1 NAD-dependent epimerase/dehydratase family protein [Thermoanaerobacterium sp. R66]
MYYNNSIYREDLKSVLNSNIQFEKIKGSSILVTGASGMIGSFLVDVLMLCNDLYSLDIDVFAMSRNKISLEKRFKTHYGNPYFHILQHDVNKELPELGDIDIIIHAASNTHPIAYASDPIGTITTNILGTYNLLDYASKHNVWRFVFVSSVEIYGENRGDVEKFDELYCGYIDCNTLRAGYPESKRAGEALCNAFMKSHGIEIVIPRLSRIYGPTMLSSDSKAIAQFIRNAVYNEDIILKSKGEQYYSFCYVSDAVSAILTILLNGRSGEAYNVSDENSDITLRELAETIARLSDRRVIFRLPDEIESIGFSKATKAILDNSKLKSLGWSAKYDLKNGLIRTIEILKQVQTRN